MPTNRELISDVVNDLRALNIDDHISKRFVLNTLRGYTRTFTKQDSDNRRIFLQTSLLTTIGCFKMLPSDNISCCNISLPRVKTFRKSKHKLPEFISTIYGDVLQVMSINEASQYLPTTPRGYGNIINREFRNKNLQYFWISDGHLIIPDSEVEVVKVVGLFLDRWQAKRLENCDESSSKCTSILDEEFICPQYLLSVVKDKATKKLFEFYKRVVVDENPDLNTNIKK